MTYPAFQTDPPGAWAVDTVDDSRTWAVIHNTTGHVKRVGPVTRPRSQSRVNYFDRAMEEAKRRNALTDDGLGTLCGAVASKPVRIPGTHEQPRPLSGLPPLGANWPFPSKIACPDPALCKAGDACAGHCRG